MPREFAIVSAEPITAIETVTAAAAVDPDLGLARLWQGGGMQIATEGELVLAVLRSTVIEERGEAERLLGQPLPVGAACLTEAYGPFGSRVTEVVAQRLASHVGGTLVEMGESR